ncbi:myozenin-2a isoform X2 [Clupea harengus]|nr:myozenin-2a isoform X2 [Clupea harengus]XP_012687920.1 myozenin-2a isoform X2 [Clupea harengus]XP_012687921.1 myozenin-2a isoform X2 [Clupea harengus]
MSMHSQMTMRERKLQAAAICREIQGPNESDMDLGRKVSAPKEIMLEELSLASNRGSRLFKLRQKRSEKYTFESIQNQQNTQINNGVTPNVEMKSENGQEGGDQGDQTPPPPSDAVPADPNIIAPGYGGPLKDVPPERFNLTSIPRSYHSPWQQALSSDPDLSETLLPFMAESEPKAETPTFKSFNRVALPFGGFGRSAKLPAPAPKDTPFSHGLSPEPPASETITLRPTFNRTALGWISDGAPLVLPEIPLDPIDPNFIPESEDL